MQDKQTRDKHCPIANLQYTCHRVTNMGFRCGCCSLPATWTICRRDSTCRFKLESECKQVPCQGTVLRLHLSLLPVIFNTRVSKGMCGDKTMKDGAELIQRGRGIPCCGNGYASCTDRIESSLKISFVSHFQALHPTTVVPANHCMGHDF